jgi:hypothetical protein
MSESQTHHGSCHCGKIQYEVKFDKLDAGMSCNCSICRKVGALRTFVPATDFKLLGGEDALTHYKFGKQNIDHCFCATCGIHSFAQGAKPDGTKMVAVNIHCLHGVDEDKLAVKKFDGAAL